MIIESLKSLAVPIDQLRGLPNNPRKGDVSAVMASLSRFGQRKPIVARRDDGTIIAGNHTWQAAKELGWKEIAVAYVGDDDVTAQAYALADNRTAELGSYDDDLLRELIESVESVDPELLRDTGWDKTSVEELFKDVIKQQESSSNSEDSDLPEEAVSKNGDLWIIGKHRILCGDSSDESNVNRLLENLTVGCILTDPPYGINLETDYSAGGGKNYKRVMNDDKPFDASIYRNKFSNVVEQFWWGANYYKSTLTSDDLAGSWLVWDKRTESTDVVVGSGFELCWSANKHKQDLLRYHWTNFTSHINAGEKRIHPTEKPVEMLEEMLTRWTDDGIVVIDFFAGSGSTLMAAARTNRIGVGIEYEPIYVDYIVKRLEKITGEKAVLVQNAESAKA
jgi:hypothetical protein